MRNNKPIIVPSHTDNKNMERYLHKKLSNIGEGGGGQGNDPNAIHFTEQSLTEEQKSQARANIGAGTYSKPTNGIPASDMASGVIPDVSGKENTSNKVTSLSAQSTDTQYPSAKAVVDYVNEHAGGNIDTVNVSVDNTSGTPSGSGSVSGSTLNLSFSGLKGAQGPQGDKGDKGDQGNSGYSGAAGELEVVNNTWQGGATSAFSAEAGKNLALEVGSMQIDGYTYHGQRIHYTTSGVVSLTPEAAILYDCILFRAKEGDKFHLSSCEGNYMIVDDTNTVLSSSTTSASTEYNITFPQNGAMIILNFYNTYDASITATRPGNIKDEVHALSGLFRDIDELSVKVEDVRVKKMDVHPGKNLYEKDKATAGKHLNSDGDEITDATCAISDYIPVEPSATYYLSASDDLPAGVGSQYICYYDENFDFISSVANNTKTLNTPDTCAYVRFSNYTYNNSAYSIDVQLEKGAARTDYEKYNKYGDSLDGFVGFVQMKEEAKAKFGIVGKNTHIKRTGTAAAGGTFNTASGTNPIRVNLSKNILASFRLKGTVSDVTVGFGISEYGNPAFCQLSVDLTPTTAKVYLYTDYKVMVNDFTHGLTLDQDTTIRFYDNLDGKDKITLTISNGAGDMFTGVISDWGGIGSPYVVNNGSYSLDVEVSVFPRDASKRIWLFGDSYISFSDPARWPYYLVSDNMTDWLSDSLPGQPGSAGLKEFRFLLGLGFVPAMVFWTLGMNDGSDTQDGNDYVISASKKATVDAFVALCEKYKITPVFATIPTVPTRQHYGYNTYVKSLGYPVVDFADAVGATSEGVWNTGLLSGDGVHPTAAGAKVMCARVLLDFPEISITD